MNPAIFDRPSGIGALLGPGDIATPKAGYSLRYLSINYFGQPVIRVRKDVVGNPEQDFTPNQLTDGTLATFLGANDGFVSKWYDQFGSNDAEQTTASAQPKIWDASTGLVTENGKPALEFDGTNELTATGFAGTSVQDTYFVMKYTTGGDQERMSMYDLRSNDTNRYSYYADFGDPGAPFASYGLPSLYVNGALTSVTDRSDVYDEFITGVQFLRVDEGADTSTWQDISFGFWFSSFGYIGTLQEWIIYNSDQSANRTKIEDNINDYYDIY